MATAQQKALHLFSRGLGGKGRAIDGRNIQIYIFCFPILFPNMSGISASGGSSLSFSKFLLLARWQQFTDSELFNGYPGKTNG